MHHSLSFVLLVVPSVLAGIFEDFSQLPSKQYDFIIAGGGTAGLVVANRLTEDPNINVLVVEAGGSHQGVLDMEVPWLSSRLQLDGAPFDWNTLSTPQSALNGRIIRYPRARVLGGSSSHNGMIWIRGSTDDYNRWAEVTGDKGWSWKEMIPYFKKTEKWTAAPGHGSENGDFDPKVHGFKGPLGIGLNNVIQPTDPLVFQTAKDLPEEFPFLEDTNAGRPIGLAWTQFSISNGTRTSAATAYLDPVVERPNLSVLIDTYVTRILRTSKDSFRTIEFAQNQTSPRHQLTATKELILSAGVIGTPQILLNSGIGDPSVLAKVGSKVIFSLPSVGKNFSNEPMVTFSWGANNTVVNLNANETVADAALQEWMTSRSGPMSGGSESTSAYFRLPEDSPVLSANGDPSAGPNTPHFSVAVNANGFFAGTNPNPPLTVIIEVSEPASRGSVSLASTDPFELPALDLGFYSAPVDIAIVMEAFKKAEQYVTAPAWQGFTLGRITPPPSIATEGDIEQVIRNITNAASHGIGTSAMSARGANHGVVDPDLKVKGITGLRIIDAGVIPFSPSANTQAPVYAIAERASDLIKKAWKLK